MTERRKQHRLTDSDLVMIGWHDGSRQLNQLGNVQDLSLGGMGLLLHQTLAVGTRVTVSYGDGELEGVVRHHSELIDVHFVGVEFVGSSKNSALHFQPELMVSLA